MSSRAHRTQSSAAASPPFSYAGPAASSSGSSSASSSGPHQKTMQVVFESVAKLLELLILSRCPVPSVACDRSRFNLHLPTLPSVRSLMQSLPLTRPITVTFFLQGPGGAKLPMEQVSERAHQHTRAGTQPACLASPLA